MAPASQPASQPPPQYYSQQSQQSAAMTAGRFAPPLPDSRAQIANNLRIRAQHQMQGPQGVGGGGGGGGGGGNVVGGGQTFLIPSQSQVPTAHPGNLMVQRGSLVRDRLKLVASGQQQPSQAPMAAGGFQQMPQPGENENLSLLDYCVWRQSLAAVLCCQVKSMYSILLYCRRLWWIPRYACWSVDVEHGQRRLDVVHAGPEVCRACRWSAGFHVWSAVRRLHGTAGQRHGPTFAVSCWSGQVCLLLTLTTLVVPQSVYW